MSSETLYWNGVDGETGGCLFPPTTSRELAAHALGERFDRGELDHLERWRESLEYRRLREGRDPTDLAQAGWGVIFAARDRRIPALREALAELLEHRRAQAAAVHEHFYQEYAGERGYRHGESKIEFLARHGAGPGAADPDRMPYYLLIVGEPETIPFSFQYQLDIQYAVGRICFDTLAEYAAYARSVVAAETGPPLRSRRAVLFAPRHPGDAATDLSGNGLAAPLAERLACRRPGWEIATAFGPQATKARLAALLNGDEEAAFVFTAGHGLGYAAGHHLQRSRQGSLICQDFPGFAHWNGQIKPDHFFNAHDVGDGARVHGLVTFHFACYSAGMPALEDPSPRSEAPPATTAPRAFLSRLAQRLVGHPGGGALAVVGHVDRAWQLSIEWPGAGRSIVAFEEALDRLLAGKPVGYAMEPFGERYAELASDLAEELEVARFGATVDDAIVSRLWTGRNDSRNYAVVGDPAVRLAVAPEPADDDDGPDVLRGFAFS
jgi:hypothetical protein